jgi:hypothetical protein
MLPENHNKVLWCVYGGESFPILFACVIRTITKEPVIWGYSVYRRSPGFRTFGRRVDPWAQENNAKFFDEQQNALAYIGALTTPKCDVDGNKLKGK